jgi:hypothetical protein
MYSVRGRNAATAATADHAVWGFWNPHASQRIKVISFSMFAQGAAPAAGWAGRIIRTTARGTAGSTVTPGIQNHSTRGVAPPSGVLLDLAAYSAQPTLDTTATPIFGYPFAAVQGSGFIYPIPGGIEIGPAAGIAFAQVPATASAVMEITLTWMEDWL